MGDIKLRPCPFCGSAPVFPLAKDVYGTCFEAGCEDCGIATLSIQIIDCFDYEESPTRENAHASYCEKDMQYGHNYIGIVRDIAIAEWNKRNDDTMQTRIVELEGALGGIYEIYNDLVESAEVAYDNGPEMIAARKALKDNS
tara:strand:- start:592 stop:1017 length:426 start_codon:yes stop_codon:yes gene_type:complete